MRALEAAADYCAAEGLPFAEELRSLHRKITTPRPAAAFPFHEVARIQKVLVDTSSGKVAAVPPGTAPAYWAVVGRRLAQAGATVEQAAVIGPWLARQGWMTGTMTVDQVARGWPSYAARAAADAAKEGPHDQGRKEFES